MSDVIGLLVFATATGQPGWGFLVPLAMVMIIVYFLILLPAKKQRQKVQEFQDALQVGDKVITTGGIYGQITRVNDKSVQLQVAEKVKIEIARVAIGGKQGEEPVVQDAGTS